MVLKDHRRTVNAVAVTADGRRAVSDNTVRLPSLISSMTIYTVGRAFEVSGSQKNDLWLFEEQLARWNMDKLSVGQRHEVDRLTEQVARCRIVIESILSLA